MRRIAEIPKSQKRKILITNIIIELVIALLIILWIYTGANKLFDYNDTKLQMGRSPFIQPISSFTAIVIPVSELLIAVFLVFKRTRTVGLYGSFFLMLLFTGYIYIMLHYSPYIPCSCGGVLAALSWEEHLVFNIAFLLISLLGLLLTLKVSKIKEAAYHNKIL